jgi:3-methyladenine DNA glycosylase Tag
VTAALPPAFAAICEAALERHGGTAAVEARLATPKSADELRALPDDRYLSQMSLRIFRAGLKHELVDRKWPAFEEVFHGFDPGRCARLYDEDLEAMLEDRRLIRHMGKLRAVRGNAKAMLEVAREHGSFGAWVAGWPADDVVSLWEALAKRFSQLGGNSAPMFLRMVGKDMFIVTDSVAGALRRWGVIDGAPTTRADRAMVQRAFNAWAGETGRPLCQLSQILAMSAD